MKTENETRGMSAQPRLLEACVASVGISIAVLAIIVGLLS